MSELDYYRQQSVFTDPGIHAELWDSVKPTIADMKAAITPLLFHYRADGDWAENGVAPERMSEASLRYASDMLTCITEIKPIEIGADRKPNERMVGCCRDWALLFVSLARHHGYAARSRVGFNGYSMDGWWIDHTVAELWDETEQRWRLVDPELTGGWTLESGQRVEPLDISRKIFLTGLEAWREVRAGNQDSSKFVVHPDIDMPQLRDIPYLWHNAVLDLAALNRHEMVLWDVWGLDLEVVNPEGAALLDEVAASTSLAERQEFFARDEFRVPEKVLSFQPDADGPVEVTIRQA